MGDLDAQTVEFRGLPSSLQQIAVTARDEVAALATDKYASSITEAEVLMRGWISDHFRLAKRAPYGTTSAEPGTDNYAIGQAHEALNAALGKEVRAARRSIDSALAETRSGYQADSPTIIERMKSELKSEFPQWMWTCAAEDEYGTIKIPSGSEVSFPLRDMQMVVLDKSF